MRRLLTGLICLLSTGLLFACGDSEPLLPEGACTGNVLVTVSSGLTPEMTWTPNCGVGVLLVAPIEGGLAWQISGVPGADQVPTNPIRSGVIYGILPPGTHQFFEMAALEPGRSYAVALHVVDREGTRALVGSESFTP
jgi:hypothetical protein